LKREFYEKVEEKRGQNGEEDEGERSFENVPLLKVLNREECMRMAQGTRRENRGEEVIGKENQSGEAEGRSKPNFEHLNCS